MRNLTLFLLCATPVHAWEFSPTPVCTLSHTEQTAAVAVTFDHATALYAIAVTRANEWPSEPAFSIRFDGAQPNIISTTRHTTSGQTLTVTDTGFGNVLDGIEFNATATAFTQTTAVSVSLEGAVAPLQAFRACATAKTS